MPRFFISIVIFQLFTSTLYCQSSPTVNFRLKPGQELRNIQSLKTIGIRGNTPPLSWEKTFPLTDNDGDGVYEAGITFNNLSAGALIEYKFIHDNKSWESIDNRVYIPGMMPASMPVAEWNQPNILSPEDFPLLTPDQLLKDYAIAKNALLHLHPGLYRYQSKEEVENRFSSYADAFNRPMTYSEAYLQFSRMTASIRCGHTYANFYNQSPLVKELVFKQKDKLPFCFSFTDRKMIITENLSEDESLEAGTEIISINDVPVQAIIDSLLLVVKADGANDGKRIRDLDVSGMGRYESFDIYFPLLFLPKAGNYFIKVTEYGSGNQRAVTVKALSREERKTLLFSRYKMKELSNDELLEYRMIEPGLAYLKLGTFVTWQMKMNWKTFLDNAFNDLEQKRIPNLVIDIRGNEGGNDDVIAWLVKALAKKPVSLEQGKKKVRYQRIPADLEPYLSSWDDSFKDFTPGIARGSDGWYELKDENPSGSLPAQKNAYEGRVYLLVNEGNSSATFYLAQIIKNNQLAILVGQTTGGSQRGLNGGQTAFLKLPHSKIELDIPLIGTFFDNKPDQGVEPDIVVHPSVADLIQKRDTELEKVRQVIRK